MDIAALSMLKTQYTVGNKIGVSLLSNIKDDVEQQASTMIKMMEQSVNPNIGQNIDVKL